MAYSKMEVFKALSSSKIPFGGKNLQNITWNIFLGQCGILLVKISRSSFEKRNYLYSSYKQDNNQAGSTFISRMAHGSEQSIPDVVRTYLVMESSLEAETIREELYSLTDISEKERYEALIELEDVIKTLVRNVLIGHTCCLDLRKLSNSKNC
ncbi:MAG: hypothetical protein CM1200mP30_19430 [Pseudomonadota bacterium]|nr:MAG: hypothetical protein CM1200mP30_19430 [Pseudomonadota bacterium]